MGYDNELNEKKGRRGRPQKYTVKDLIDITSNAIKRLDPLGTNLREITKQDIIDEVKKIDPNYERGDIDRPEATAVFNEYEKVRLQKLSKDRSKEDMEAVQYLQTFNPYVFYDRYSKKPEKMKEALIDLAQKIGMVLHIGEVTQNKLSQAHAELYRIAENNGGASQRLIADYQKQKDLNDSLRKENEELKKALDNIDQMAANIIIKENHLGKVKVIENPRSKVLTYLDFSERKRKMIEEMMEGMPNGEGE